MKRSIALCATLLAGISLTGCGTSLKTYVKEDASWGTIQRFAVTPFTLPSDNAVHRESVTQLFASELRQVGLAPSLVDVPLKPADLLPPTPEQIAKEYQVDAVFQGSVDEANGVVIHVKLVDAATGDVLWSATDLLGVGAEYFSLKTVQQQLQKRFRRMAKDFAGEYPGPSPVS